MVGKMSKVLLVMTMTVSAVYCIVNIRPKEEEQTPEVSDVCLGCICDAVTKCDGNRGCDKHTCGLFKMTKAFWTDAGQPTLEGETVNGKSAFENCAKDVVCAAKAIKGYMDVYQKDCNKDGVIDCEDHMRIHWHGPGGCTKPLPRVQKEQFVKCVSAARYYGQYFNK